MQLLLTALNAKYIHASMALYVLQTYLNKHGFEAKVREFTINQDLQWILGQIIRESPELVGISTNIWNVDATRTLCRWIKAVRPEIRIVVGGPEVDPDPESMLRSTHADYAIVGEGEEPLLGLVRALSHGAPLDTVPGLAWLDKGAYVKSPLGPPIVLEAIPFPYPQETLKEPGRIFYYETSRGCPFTCSYCLSGAERGMRYLPLERVFADLEKLVQADVRQVKFIDRTFNTDERRTVEILNHIVLRYADSKTNFHLELVGELLTEEILTVLARAPKGLFRVEIGIQSVHPPTLVAIGRRNVLEKLERNLHRLLEPGNIPVHLDLIAGLPEEGMAEFARTFNWTYRRKAEEIQLGILKLLKGSELGKKARAMGYIATEEAPYEVLTTPWLSFEELDRLKTIAHLVDLFHNSGHFGHTLGYLSEANGLTPFSVFDCLAELWEDKSMDAASHSMRERFHFMRDALPEIIREPSMLYVATELLRLDRALADWGYGEDDVWGEIPDLPESLRQALTNTVWVSKNLPELEEFAPNDRRRRVRRWRLGVDPRNPEAGERTIDILVYRPMRGKIAYRLLEEVSL